MQLHPSSSIQTKNTTRMRVSLFIRHYPHLAGPLYPPFLVETEKPVTGPVDSVLFSPFLH